MQRGLLLTSSGGFRLLDQTSDYGLQLESEAVFEHRMQLLDIHGLQETHIYADREAAWRHRRKRLNQCCQCGPP